VYIEHAAQAAVQVTLQAAHLLAAQLLAAHLLA